jgi:hypothetical protein
LLESKFKRSVSIVFDFATGTRSGQEPSYVRKNNSHRWRMHTVMYVIQVSKVNMFINLDIGSASGYTNKSEHVHFYKALQ